MSEPKDKIIEVPDFEVWELFEMLSECDVPVETKYNEEGS